MSYGFPIWYKKPVSIVEQLMQTHLHVMVRRAAVLVDDLGSAQECVADAFLAVHLVVAAGEIDDASQAARYLNTCVTNNAFSVLRRRRTARGRAHLFVPDHEPAAEQTVVDALTASEEQKAVMTAIRALSARERQVVTMQYYDGLGVADIAAQLGIAEGTVKRTASDARARLAKLLGDLR